MIISHKISSYEILIISDYAKGGGYQKGYIHLYGENSKYIGYFGIIKDGKTLPRNKKQNNGVLQVYFHESELQIILNTLRNQMSIALQFDTRLHKGWLVVDKTPAANDELAA